MVQTRGLERDGLTLQDPWVSSRRPRHHVASNLLLRRSALQDHGGGRVVVHGGIMASVWCHALARLLRRQSHVTELGVEGVRLETEISVKRNASRSWINAVLGLN